MPKPLCTWYPAVSYRTARRPVRALVAGSLSMLRVHTVQSCIAGQGGLLPIHREATCSVVQYACTPHLLGMSSRASPSRSSARTGRRPHHLSGLARPLTPSNWTCWKALCGHLHLFPQRLPPLLPLFSDSIGRRHGSPLWCHSNGSSNGPGHYPLP